MSDTHINARGRAGNKISGLRRTAVGLAIALSVSLSSPMVSLADGELALKNVKCDANKQLIIEFASGQGVPQGPTISEVPAPTHQLLIDFTGVSLDDKTIPAGDDLTRQLASQMPGVKRASVGVLAAASVPTVRVALDLDPDLAIKPAIVSLQDGAAVISLGDAYAASASGASPDASTAGAVAAAASSPSSAGSASSDPAAAYEEYYRKFLQQKQLSDREQMTKDQWGPRKGTLAEAQAVKSGKGVRIIGTPIDSPAVKAAEIAPAPASARRKSAPVAQAPAPAEQPAAAPEAVAAAPAAATSAPVPVAAAAPVETPAPAESTATAAPGEMTPVAAPQTATSQIGDTAPTPAPKEETQAQPDMVGDEPAAAPAPARPAPAAKPVHKIAAALPKAAPEPEAVPSGDTTAAPDETVAGSDEDPVKRAKRLFNQGYQNHIHGKINEAIAMYKQAIKVDAQLGDAHSNLGLAYNQQHNYANALSEFHKALACNPRDAITYNGIGAALRAEQDMPGAIKNWETAVEIDPRLAVAHYNLGTAYEAEGQPEKAMASYEAAVKNDQHLGEAYFRMGIIMQKKHRLQEARAHFKKSLTVAEDSDYAAEARQKIAAIDKLAK